ncbi:PHD finger protein ING1-like [Hibiscus syriacus]|uniref:PHD finger protein ING1-like n=1 Tax=Hibiscus syriacus TaxID=106335 RepID=UPI0019214693|nr:PHD finger protein ING1-like [Hibiscus syriacus]
MRHSMNKSIVLGLQMKRLPWPFRHMICKTRLATAAASSAATEVAATAANPTGMELDLPVDPNEPTYCLCNQVSYGEMVACDNPACKIEWFHFGCVGLKEQPGKWYCPDCAALRNRRKGK